MIHQSKIKKKYIKLSIDHTTQATQAGSKRPTASQANITAIPTILAIIAIIIHWSRLLPIIIKSIWWSLIRCALIILLGRVFLGVALVLHLEGCWVFVFCGRIIIILQIIVILLKFIIILSEFLQILFIIINLLLLNFTTFNQIVLHSKMR